MFRSFLIFDTLMQPHVSLFSLGSLSHQSLRIKGLVFAKIETCVGVDVFGVTVASYILLLVTVYC